MIKLWKVFFPLVIEEMVLMLWMLDYYGYFTYLLKRLRTIFLLFMVILLHGNPKKWIKPEGNTIWCFNERFKTLLNWNMPLKFNPVLINIPVANYPICNLNSSFWHFFCGLDFSSTFGFDFPYRVDKEIMRINHISVQTEKLPSNYFAMIMPHVLRQTDECLFSGFHSMNLAIV